MQMALRAKSTLRLAGGEREKTLLSGLKTSLNAIVATGASQGALIGAVVPRFARRLYGGVNSVPLIPSLSNTGIEHKTRLDCDNSSRAFVISGCTTREIGALQET